jgi:hypothetical protein
MFSLHKSIAAYKKCLINNINNSNSLLNSATIGNYIGHEGFVVRYNGIYKLVQRDIFSKTNFDRNDR